MNRGLIVILALLTAGIAAAAFFTMNKRSDALAKESVEQQLVPGLKGKLASIDTIKVEMPGETVTLMKMDSDRWAVQERKLFPAEREKLQKIFVGLSELKPLEAKTSNPELYSRLGVAEPSNDEGAGTRVTLSQGGAEVASLIIGNVKAGYGATQERYVRASGDERAWLVRSPIAADGAVATWLSRKLIDIAPDRIRRIEVDRWDDEDLAIGRESQALKDFSLLTLPEGTKAKTTGEIATLSRVLQNVQLEDVLPAAEAPDDTTSNTTLTAETFDGLRLVANLSAKNGSEYYATLSAEYDEALRADEPPAEGEETELLKPAEEVQAEAAEISSKTEGWVFKLQSWKGTAMMKANKDFYTTASSSPNKTVSFNEATDTLSITEDQLEELMLQVPELNDEATSPSM